MVDALRMPAANAAQACCTSMVIPPRRHWRAPRYLVGDDVASVRQEDVVADLELGLVEVAELQAAVWHAHAHSVHGPAGGAARCRSARGRGALARQLDLGHALDDAVAGLHVLGPDRRHCRLL